MARRSGVSPSRVVASRSRMAVRTVSGSGPKSSGSVFFGGSFAMSCVPFGWGQDPVFPNPLRPNREPHTHAGNDAGRFVG